MVSKVDRKDPIPCSAEKGHRGVLSAPSSPTWELKMGELSRERDQRPWSHSRRQGKRNKLKGKGCGESPALCQLTDCRYTVPGISGRRTGGARRGGRAGRAGTGCRREGDMDRSEQGLLRTDPVPEEGEDVAATIGATETLSEDEREELRRELAKVEEEIQTLSQVLAAKEKHLAEIKRKLGINSLQELKQNIAKGWQDVTATSAYKKTSETLSQAGQKASAAFSSVGSVITKKLEDVKNSPTFKSFEEKVENLKSKVGGNKPAGGDFGEVLNSTASASATTTEPLPEQTQESL